MNGDQTTTAFLYAQRRALNQHNRGEDNVRRNPIMQNVDNRNITLRKLYIIYYIYILYFSALNIITPFSNNFVLIFF